MNIALVRHQTSQSEVNPHYRPLENITALVIMAITVMSALVISTAAFAQASCGNQSQNACSCPQQVTKFQMFAPSPFAPCEEGENCPKWTPITPNQCGGDFPNGNCFGRNAGDSCGITEVASPQLLSFLQLHPWVARSRPIYVVGCNDSLMKVPMRQGIAW